MSERKLTYHVYDPGFPGVIGTSDDLAGAIKLGNETIVNNWRPDHGDEWSLDVEGVAVYLAPPDCEEPEEDGKLVAQARAVDIVYRPDDTDEDGYSASQQDHWLYGSVESICDYRVEPVDDAGRSALEASNG